MVQFYKKRIKKKKRVRKIGKNKKGRKRDEHIQMNSIQLFNISAKPFLSRIIYRNNKTDKNMENR